MTQELVGPDRNLDYSQVESNLIKQITDYSSKALCDTLIVGVSGGVDSATVATLAAKTGKKVVLLTMPIHQNKDEVNRADEHIQRLKSKYSNVTSLDVDLTDTYETMKQTLLKTGATEEELYMSLVNTRSRLRMATLYAMANLHNALVLGTGNKVEDSGVGFFTKYGDGGVDYSPIGELTKSEVYKLAAHMGINQNILDAKPTDGLHPNGATDEDQIGASYDELERAMDQYDNGKREEDFSGRGAEVMSIYTARHEKNAHKMQMPPVASIA